MKPFLILQLREQDAAADNEFEAFLSFGSLDQSEVIRVRLERESIEGLDPTIYAGIIVGGGPSNVSDQEVDKPDYQRRFEAELDQLYKPMFEHDVPYLGCCYGLGSFVNYVGGTVSKERYSEPVGHVEIALKEESATDPLLQGLPLSFGAFCGHKEAVQEVPAGSVLLASSKACPVQMIRFKRNIYATQFHPELDAEGLIARIDFYKHHGYFDPELADDMIASAQGLEVSVPQQILKRFIDRYRQ